jgi:LPS export ABC transporter protein LptC
VATGRRQDRHKQVESFLHARILPLPMPQGWIYSCRARFLGLGSRIQARGLGSRRWSPGPAGSTTTKIYGAFLRRFRLIILGALAALILGIGLAYWLNPPASLPVLDMAGEAPANQDGKPRLRGLTYTQVEGGVRKWTLAATGARFDEDAKKITLSDVRLKFYPKGGGWITLAGKEGTYDQKNKVVVLEGQVRGRSHDGMTLETTVLTFNEQEDQVDTDAEVTVTGSRFRVRGRGMVVHIKQQTVVFKKQVDSTFIPEGKGPPPGATVEDG